MRSGVDIVLMYKNKNYIHERPSKRHIAKIAIPKTAGRLTSSLYDRLRWARGGRWPAPSAVGDGWLGQNR